MNAFDFHDEVATEEKIKRRPRLRLCARQGGVGSIGSKSVEGSGLAWLRTCSHLAWC